jgi:prevent-host-death family protein
MIRVTATEAARSFSDLLNRVRYKGEAFIVVRNGEAICRIEPVDDGARPATVRDLVELLRHGPSPDDAYGEDLRRIRRKQPKLSRSPWDS